MKRTMAITMLIITMSIVSLDGTGRLRSYFKFGTPSNQTLKKIRSSLPTSITSLNAVHIKNVLPAELQEKLQPEMLSEAYRKLENQLPISIKPIDLLLIAIGLMVGLPIGLIIDFNATYTQLRKVALITGTMKKIAFTATYPKNGSGAIIPTQDELLQQLKTLADLNLVKKAFMEESHEYELKQGEKSQADAWLLGYLYRQARGKSIHFEDIVLLYQSAFTQLHLRLESGLKDTVADLDTQFDWIAEQEPEVLITYDENSIPAVKKYWHDLREDLRNRFEKELEARQKKNLNK